MRNINLWVIMPVYNEEEALPIVLNQWLPVLRELLSNFTLLVLNDGSKDKTLEIAKNFSLNNSEIKVIDKANSGHGQTCIYGYNYALENNAEWIFQIDSDGQCNPQYFELLLKNIDKYKAIYGYRKTRDDGFQRFIVSRIVTLFVYTATGVWVSDANVPYRLMHKTALEKFIHNIPEDFYLSNILVSTLQQKNFGIKWEAIHFDDRCGGTPSVKNSIFAKHGINLFKQLRNFVRIHKI